MKSWHILINLVLIAAALTACGGEQATEPSEPATIDLKSDALNTSYDDALDVSAQLVLGSLQLEDTQHAVTPEQAKTLLPLWQALQGSVTAEDEVSAVLRGIEGAMTDEQLRAIADMRLTQEDVEAWMEEQGLNARGGLPGGEGVPDARATRQAELESMSEEEREAMKATARAGGGMGGGVRGGRGEGGGRDSGDVATGGLGGARFLLRPLIELLSERAGVNGS